MTSVHGLFRISSICEKFVCFVLSNRHGKLTMQIKYENGCIISVDDPKKCEQLQQVWKIWPKEVKADYKTDMI